MNEQINGREGNLTLEILPSQRQNKGHHGGNGSCPVPYVTRELFASPYFFVNLGKIGVEGHKEGRKGVGCRDTPGVRVTERGTLLVWGGLEEREERGQ